MLDFADFATAASPAAPSHTADTTFAAAASTGRPNVGFQYGLSGRPYTKWYRVWERVTIEDFYQEMIVLPIILAIVLVHVWGAGLNRKRVKQWAVAHFPLLEAEYASVGYGTRSQADPADIATKGFGKTIADSGKVPAELLREKSKNEFTTYCTGRQNVAWTDIKLTLYKRYNPFLMLGEWVLSFLFDAGAPPAERFEATTYCFDGKEKSILPAATGGAPATPGNKDSSYDNFVWAIVHKERMKQLRDDRYDLSLTTTKEHPSLPVWCTVMSESSQVTDALLTPELVAAVTAAGDALEALIVTDQPIDAPRKLDETASRKRVALSLRLPAAHDDSTVALFAYFLRLPDILVTTAHFRPEALRKVKATREEAMRKLKRADEEEKAEERRLAGDKLKKEERDRRLAGMSAEEQKKFLEKEKEKSQRKAMKKQTMRG